MPRKKICETSEYCYADSINYEAGWKACRMSDDKNFCLRYGQLMYAIQEEMKEMIKNKDIGSLQILSNNLLKLGARSLEGIEEILDI